MSRYTLGLCTMDNSAAALFLGGQLVAAVEQERLSRIKNDGAFPYLAIDEVLSMEGIGINNVATIAVYWQPWRIGTRAYQTLKKSITVPGNSIFLLSRAFQVLKRSKSEDSSGNWFDLFRIKSLLVKRYGNIKAKVVFVDHHSSHKDYATTMCNWNFFFSLSYDGGGEALSSILTAHQNGRETIISKHYWPNSLGHFYSTFTGFLGFKMLEGEYKMMGLAPYGEPSYKELLLKHIIKLKPRGVYSLNTRICDYHAAIRGKFNKKFLDLFGSRRMEYEQLTQEHINLACSVQNVFEEAQLHMLKFAKKNFPNIHKLYLSGGCALNVTANGRLLNNFKGFNKVMIPAAPHDAGCAIGAAISTINEKIDKTKVRSPYLGRFFHAAEIEKTVKKYTNNFNKYEDETDLLKKTAMLLSRGKIIAWFQGRAEFGPRALGSRSFLADPRRDNIREEINKKIKKRELFRPFAPSILMERAKDFFSITQHSPYMNIVAGVKSKKLPATTHVDNTSRIHTVTQNQNRRYYSLIKEFEKLTKIPVLLNTSFNIQEPIVYSPEDAFKTFIKSDVDVLVLDNFIITRDQLV